MNKISSGVYPCYENQFKCGATKETATTPSELESFSVSIDNGVEEWTPFTAEGWKSALQTAKGMTISVTGKRDIGNAGNDFVAGKAFVNGQAAYGYFCWTLPDGTTVEWDKAVYSVTNISAGDSTAVGPLEFDIISNGKPRITLPETSGSSTTGDSSTSDTGDSSGEETSGEDETEQTTE